MVHPADFLGDILDQPHDDAPRLRYAEWLDERDDPLGEFIRVQCRAARLPARHPEMLKLERRERQLLAEYEREWVADLAGRVQWWVFRRGFVEEVSLTSVQFLIHAPAIFEQAPILELHLCRVWDRLEGLASSAFLQKPAYLDLSGNPLRDHGLRTLLQSPYLCHVQGLNLSSSGIGDQGARAIADSPHLTELRELYLCDNRISDAGVRALAVSPLASRLDTLHLRFNAIGSDGANLLQRRLGERAHV